MQQRLSEQFLVFVSAFVIVLVSSSGMLFCRVANRDQAAERYYAAFEPIKYWVMKLCQSILMIALSYNVRYVLVNAASAVKACRSLKWCARMIGGHRKIV